MNKVVQNDMELRFAAQLRTQRFYEVLARTNHAIIHSKNAGELFDRICDAAVTLKMCDAAWIGLLQEDGELSPMACAGTTMERIRAIRFDVKDQVLQTHSVAVKSIIDGKPCLRNDYLAYATDSNWINEMQRVGVRSAGALPLYRHGKVVGALVISDAQAHFFNDELSGLLVKMADSISFFLDAEADDHERQKAEAAIREAELRYRTLVDLLPNGVHIYRNGLLFFLNRAGRRLFGVPDTTDHVLYRDVIDPENWPVIEQRIARVESGKVNPPLALRGRRIDGARFDMELTSAPFLHDGAKACIVVTRDLTHQMQREKLVLEQARILESAARGKPLPDILRHLSQLVEEQTSGLVSSIMLLSEDGRRLHIGGNYSLSPEFCAAVDGIEIGPTAGTCGSAAFRRESVIVTDIASDPLWKDYRVLAHAEGLRACWSVPLFASDGDLVGTFASYFMEPRGPTGDEISLMNILSGVAEVAIERDRDHRKLVETKKQLLKAQHLAKLGDWQLDFTTRQFSGSDVVFDILGLDKSNGPISLDAYTDLVHPLDRARLLEARARAFAGVSTQLNAEYRIIRPDGMIRHVDARGVVVFGADRRPLKYSGILQDITDRKIAEQALILNKRALESASSGIVICDALASDMPVIFANQAFERITGYTQDEVIGKNCRFLQKDQNDQPGSADIRNAVVNKKEGHAVLLNFRKDGTPFWNDLKIAPVRDADGTVTHFIGNITDVSDAIRYEKELAFQANHDALTGLPNRNLLEDRLEQVISFAKRRERQVGIVFVDLDNFKIVNDTLGHNAGDRLLKAVAQRFVASLRDGDTVSRLGGDEFVVVCPDLTEMNDMNDIISRIFGNLREPLLIDDQEIRVDASMGIAMFPKDGQTAGDLLKCADMAMYRAKALGRGNNQYYVEELGVRVSQKRKTEQELRQALERGEFTLHYQPKVGTRNGEICGMEALIRWNHPERGMIPPMDFIPIAEESNLIIPIGEWVMVEACRQNQEWHAAGLSGFPVSVNTSPAQLRQKDFSDIVMRVLKQTGLPPHLLELEITESLAMESPDLFISTLEKIKALGIRISIDDFGTGYSSLNYLTRFPIDVLKIDRSFVRDITTDAGDAAVCRTIITLAQNLNLIVVAEGVETEAQASYLKRHQCDELQGFLLCRPESAASITCRLRKKQQLLAGSGIKESRQRTLLILDDDEDTLDVLTMLLEPDGYHVLASSSPSEALKMLAEHDVSVIMTDQRMQEMNGTEFLQLAKNMHPDSVRIVLSGHADFDALSEAVNRGAIYKFLRKPWDTAMLLATVRDAFRHHDVTVRNLELRRRPGDPDGPHKN
jgi:diguanylate cyclase (GGDEF)-like protein/PAS domain S-box-containing protein